MAVTNKRRTFHQGSATGVRLSPGVTLIIAICAILAPGSSASSADSQLLASTFLGSSGSDLAHGARSVDFDSEGNIFVVIQTDSQEFPDITFSGLDSSHNGAQDLLLCRFAPDLSSVTNATFLGGSGDDTRPYIMVDGEGNVLVAGMTTSNDFPTSPGCYQNTRPGGDVDLFIAKLTNDLSTLVASTYVGSEDIDQDARLAIAENGDILMTALSTGDDFPVTPYAYDTSFNGWGDLVICRFSPDLTQLWASTFLGGEYTEDPRGIHVDSEGSIFITGMTQSSDFPTTLGAYDETFNGPPEWDEDNTDVVISKFSGDLSELLASTYIGGSYYDSVTNSHMNAREQIVITGHTRSVPWPVTPGGWSAAFIDAEESDEIFITIFTNDLLDVTKSTVLFNKDNGQAILPMGSAMDEAGNVYISGITYCYILPTTPNAIAVEHAAGDARDLFLCKFHSNLDIMKYCTYLGGTAGDFSLSLATGSGGLLVGAGHTSSEDFPITSGVSDGTFNGGQYDGYVALFDLSLFNCCGYFTGGITGNANCSPDGKITLSDLSRMIDRVYVSRTQLCCEGNGDVNGMDDGSTTLSDCCRLIDHLYISKLPTAVCPH